VVEEARTLAWSETIRDGLKEPVNVQSEMVRVESPKAWTAEMVKEVAVTLRRVV